MKRKIIHQPHAVSRVQHPEDTPTPICSLLAMTSIEHLTVTDNAFLNAMDNTDKCSAKDWISKIWAIRHKQHE